MNETTNGWDEYKKLIISSLERLQSDVEKLRVSIVHIDNYNKFHSEFETFKDDFYKFVRVQEMLVTELRTRQAIILGMVSTVATIVLGAIISMLIK